MQIHPMPSEEQNQLVTLERLTRVARKSAANDPRLLCRAVENEIARAAIYTGASGNGVRVRRVEYAESTNSVVVVVASVCDGTEEKIPFLAFFELYRPTAFV